ncbi:MAG: hypothetical protein IJ134_04395 [Bacilli bacterium]|nr:hypothetical protein [Bacilli bacterium]
MGLFDMFKKKKVEQKSNLPENKYYKGNDIFKDDEVKGNEISIRIIKSIEIPGHSNLYECTVQYGIPSALITDAWENEDLRFFEKLIMEFDKNEMINNPDYAKFVLTKLLRRERVRELHDIEFGLIDGKKNGNYIGSVSKNNGNLSITMNDEIGTVIETLPATKKLQENYKEYISEKEQVQRNIDESTSTSRKERIEYLKQELANLEKREEEYQSSKNK